METINNEPERRTTYSYDDDNRVTSVTTDDITSAYTYDTTSAYSYDVYSRVSQQQTSNDLGTILT